MTHYKFTTSMLFAVVLIHAMSGYSRPSKIEKFTLKNCLLHIEAPVIINDEKAFKEFIKSSQCPDLSETSIDFTKNTLIAADEEFADCNAHFQIEFEKDEQAKSCKVLVKEQYGGCRGMNSFGIFIVLEKLSSEYKVEVSHQREDRN